MAALDDLHAALTAGDCPGALDHALVAWRETRDPELADLIDRITAKCELPSYPEMTLAEKQLWFVQRGRDDGAPDAVTTAALLAMLGNRVDHLDSSINATRARWATAPRTPLTIHLGTSNAWPTNFQERAAVLLGWPDDPRVAMAIVEVVRSAQPPHAHNVPMYELLADRVADIGDVRVLDKLSTMSVEPRGGYDVLRRWQVMFATRALAQFTHKTPPRGAGPELAACIAMLPAEAKPPAPRPRADLEALWREVAEHPDDVGVRAVLGDALVEAGDLRGDAIVLQCNSRNPKRPLRGSNRSAYDGRVKTLLRKEWDTWFGDLTLVLARRACEFRCGMLEVATVGLATSPDWAFAKAKGHRELACVHTVRPGWVSTANFATFVLGLPRMPTTLALTGIAVIDELAARGAAFDRLHTVEMIVNPVTGPDDRPLPDWTAKPLRDALARLAVVVPGVRELIVKNHAIARMFVDHRREIRLMFPALVRLAVDPATAVVVRDLIDDNTFTVA